MSAQEDTAGIYAKVLGTLLALTVITVLAAGFEFGSWNTVIALGIASVKASLVALFFMHLRHDKPMSAVIFVAGAATLGVFLMICTLDSGARVEDRVRPATRDTGLPALSAPVPSRSGQLPPTTRPLPTAQPGSTPPSAK